MKFLLDTHVWLWLLENPAHIDSSVLQQLQEAETLCLSVVSLWEASIKQELGKLHTTLSIELLREEFLREIGSQELAIEAQHALAAARLPMHHRDPFDRVLIAQAIQQNLILVSADHVLQRYPAKILWAR